MRFVESHLFFTKKSLPQMESGNTELKQKKTKNRWRRIFLFVAGSFAALLLLVLILLSPIAEYLIETFDVEYTGRQIEVEKAVVNPFTGYVYLIHPKIY